MATVSPSIRGGAEFSPFIRSHGYLFPGGHCPTVGLGGYLLQGGQGWNGRLWGWACESVLAVDAVTADGELVRASADSHPDLYWAARGAGPGFFGAVTRFHLQLFDLPPVFVQTALALPIDHFDDVLRWAHDVLPTLDRRVEPVIVGTRIPPDGVDIGGAPMMIMLATGLFDSQDEADRLMRPLQDCPGLDDAYMREFAAPVTFDIVGAIQEAMSPSGHRYAADCVWTDATADELAPLLRDLYTSLPTPQSFTIWYGWNPVRPLPDMAFSMEANVYVATYAVWSDPADDDAGAAVGVGSVPGPRTGVEGRPISATPTCCGARHRSWPPTTFGGSPRSATSTTRTDVSPTSGSSRARRRTSSSGRSGIDGSG